MPFTTEDRREVLGVARNWCHPATEPLLFSRGVASSTSLSACTQPDRCVSLFETMHPVASFVPRTSLLESPFELEITTRLLTSVFPRLNPTKAAPFVGPLNVFLKEYQITSVCRIACFLGQVAEECAEMSMMEEGLFYTTPAALNAFGKRIPESERATYLRQPQKLANHVYAGRNGNSDEASGDGWRYRGRGLMQITGKNTYAKFAAASGQAVLGDPDGVTKPYLAVWSACWYWDWRKANLFADSDNLPGLTQAINGGLNGFNHRVAATDSAKRQLRLQLGLQ